VSTHDKSQEAVEASTADEQRQGRKRQYRKPTIADFLQSAVAFGSPTDYFSCTT